MPFRFSRNVQGRQREGGSWAPSNQHRGRLSSWAAVLLIVIGFATVGLAMVLWPAWWLLILGVAFIVLGGLQAAWSGIITDVVLAPPVENKPEEPYSVPLREVKEAENPPERKPGEE